MCDNIVRCENFSNDKIVELNKLISTNFTEPKFEKKFLDNVCIYACGSLGRKEISHNSDLDLFFVNTSEIIVTNLDKYLFFSKLYHVNKTLKFKPPSKNGAYWDFHLETDLLDIGSQSEDFNNCFTSRLLLILESIPVLNSKLYNRLLDKTIEAYFIEYEKYNHNFMPMYMINDILRYWYTLTLNYEFRRDKSDAKQIKYWKRLKLKYSRLLTCYVTIACLFENSITPDFVKDLLQIPPLKRLDILSEKNNKLFNIVKNIKDEYDWFLSLTRFDSDWWNTNENKRIAFNKAECFHELVVHEMLSEVALLNIELFKRLDI
ncbi:MAG: hypothetical protein WD607_05480 [Candidatus Paceibacterota bacterium]